MPRHPLADTLSRAASWSPEAQAELAAYAAEIEAALGVGEYPPTDAELADWVRHRFGNETYVQHQFQPKVLAAKVFGNPEALAELNAQVHPRVRARAAQWRAQQQTPYTLTEAALMMESGSYTDYNAVILVEAPLELRLQRILQRDGITEVAARQRLHAQWSDEQRRPLATHIIHNNEKEALIPQVLALHRLWWR